jgi:hypothetical protein
MPVEKTIFKDAYMLTLGQPNKFTPEGTKIADVDKPKFVIIKTTITKMFFSLEVAKQLAKDMEILLAEPEKKEVMEKVNSKIK